MAGGLRPAAFAATVLLASACSGPGQRELVVDEIPPTIGYLAVLGIDAAGVLVGATGLAPVEDGRVLVFGELPDAVGFEIVGYTAASLGELPAEATLRGAPLTAASERGARLPDASWRVGFDDEGTMLGAPPALRALTAAWLPACPRYLGPAVGVAIDCAFQDCAATFTQTGCRLSLDGRACGVGQLEADIDEAGDITVASATTLSACTTAGGPAPGVGVSLSCTDGTGRTCTIEAHTSSAAPDLTVDVIALQPGALVRDTSKARPPVGYLTGLTVLDDVVLVTRNLDRAWRWDECPAERAGVVDIIAADALTVRTATAPPCIVRTARDPRGRGLLYLRGGAPGRVGLMSAAGQVLREVSLPPPSSGRIEAPVQLLAVEEPPQIWALTSAPVGGGSTATLFALDVDTLAVTRSTSIDDQRVDLIGTGVDGQVLLVGDGADDLYTVSTTGELGPPVHLWTLCSRGFGIRPSALYGHDPSRRLVVPGIDSDSVTAYVLDESERCRPTPYPWGAADGYTASPWPSQGERVLMGLMIDETAVLALLDPRSGRFVGGGLPIGVGPPDSPSLDGRGRTWLLLPWVAQVLRLTP